MRTSPTQGCVYAKSKPDGKYFIKSGTSLAGIGRTFIRQPLTVRFESDTFNDLLNLLYLKVGLMNRAEVVTVDFVITLSNPRFVEAISIINGFLRRRHPSDHLLECQEALIEAGLEEYADV